VLSAQFICPVLRLIIVSNLDNARVNRKTKQVQTYYAAMTRPDPVRRPAGSRAGHLLPLSSRTAGQRPLYRVARRMCIGCVKWRQKRTCYVRAYTASRRALIRRRDTLVYGRWLVGSLKRLPPCRSRSRRQTAQEGDETDRLLKDGRVCLLSLVLCTDEFNRQRY